MEKILARLVVRCVQLCASFALAACSGEGGAPAAGSLGPPAGQAGGSSTADAGTLDTLGLSLFACARLGEVHRLDNFAGIDPRRSAVLAPASGVQSLHLEGSPAPQQLRGQHYDVEGAHLPAQDALLADVSSSASQLRSPTAAAVAGQRLAVYRSTVDGPYRVFGQHAPVGAESWSVPAPLSPLGMTVVDVALAAAADTGLVLAWVEEILPSGPGVPERRLWLRPVDEQLVVLADSARLSAADGVQQIALTAAQDGGVWLAYSKPGTSGFDLVVQRLDALAQPDGEAQVLAAGRAIVGQVALSEIDGGPAVVWPESGGAGLQLHLRALRQDGSPTAEVILTPPGEQGMDPATLALGEVLMLAYRGGPDAAPGIWLDALRLTGESIVGRGLMADDSGASAPLNLVASRSFDVWGVAWTALDGGNTALSFVNADCTEPL
ncbi:MAG: hypothetical protein ACPGUV_11110 [Polyangiales bacterium]